MELNYTSFGLIAFLPLIIGYFWYHPNSVIKKWSNVDTIAFNAFGIKKLSLLFLLSLILVYGYINLVIHQMGFYELFFTDIMKGSEEAKVIVDDFLGKYGDKHRHFGHGLFHGVINAFVFALPFIGFHAILDQKGRKYVLYHFLYWLITSALVCGCISEFV